jgi:hypothetical protein
MVGCGISMDRPSARQDRETELGELHSASRAQCVHRAVAGSCTEASDEHRCAQEYFLHSNDC